MIHGSHPLVPGTFLLYVDSYDNGVMTGRFYQPVTRESGIFQSMMQFLLTAERHMDTDNIPQSFHATRAFSPFRSHLCGDDDDTLLKFGKVATFSIHIMFRRGTTWQGSITWLEEKQTQQFRSALELMILIDSAVTKRELFFCQPLGDTLPLQIAE